MPQDLTVDKSTLVVVMVWYCHHLDQYCLCQMASLGSNWLTILNHDGSGTIINSQGKIYAEKYLHLERLFYSLYICLAVLLFWNNGIGSPIGALDYKIIGLSASEIWNVHPTLHKRVNWLRTCQTMETPSALLVFVRGIYQLPVISKDQCCGYLMCIWILDVLVRTSCWPNSQVAFGLNDVFQQHL